MFIDKSGKFQISNNRKKLNTKPLIFYEWDFNSYPALWTQQDYTWGHRVNTEVWTESFQFQTFSSLLYTSVYILYLFNNVFVILLIKTNVKVLGLGIIASKLVLCVGLCLNSWEKRFFDVDLKIETVYTHNTQIKLSKWKFLLVIMIHCWVWSMGLHGPVQVRHLWLRQRRALQWLNSETTVCRRHAKKKNGPQLI